MSLSMVAPMCYRNHAIKSVLDHFLSQIKTRPKRKRNAETFFQRELVDYKIAVYGKRLTSDTLFAVKTKPLHDGKMFYLYDLLK